MKKRILLLAVLLAAVAAAVGLYFYNLKMPSMATQKADLTLSAAELYAAYEADEAAANARYLGKILAVEGQVREANTLPDGTVKVVLDTGKDFGVLCEFDPNTQHKRTDFQPGERLTLQGECAGLNFDVLLSRCAVVE
ncbi:MAG: hypothetical protein RMJ33_06920 [Saprospiraceae bacterium]|nr:OB-fold putative lipoprotein [Saprospiraceae bacterium]MDW8229553.1 hypothetical protein [Saprospiraceae bacterium]